MRHSAILTGIACLLGFSSLSHAAQTIASPSSFGSSTQRSAHCSIGNTGTRPIAVKVSVVDEGGTALVVSSTCNEPLPPHFL